VCVLSHFPHPVHRHLALLAPTPIRGKEQLKSYITDYYKGLFGPSDGVQFSLDENINFDIPQVSCEENEKLTASFIEQEVKEAIFQMKHNKAPGPMVFQQNFTKSSGKPLKGT
jgi:hypothetical protein